MQISTDYTTFQSPQIQKIWEGKDWLLSKVTRIAWSFFSENIATFFQNQYFWVKSFFTTPPAVKPLVELPSKIKEDTPKMNIPYWGVFGGLLSGLAHRVTTGITMDQKFNCRKMASSMLLPGVNKIKQWELKNFALLSPAIPFLYNVHTDFQKEPAEKPLYQRMKSAVQKQFTTPSFLFFAIASTMALTNPFYSRPLGLSTKGGFDSSGHIMLKTVLAPFMASTLDKTAKTSPRLAITAALAYAVTDAVFLYNTSHLCHTSYETLAGAAWATVILGTGLAAQSLSWSNKEKVV